VELLLQAGLRSGKSPDIGCRVQESRFLLSGFAERGMAMSGARVPLSHAAVRGVSGGWSGWEAGAEDLAFLLPFSCRGVRQTAIRERACHMGGGELLSPQSF